MGGSNAKLWTSLFEQSTKEAAEVTRSVMAKVQDNMKQSAAQLTTAAVDETKIKQMVEEESQKFDKQRSEMFEKIYKAYDVDKNGLLDQKECKQLVKECLISQKTFMPTQVNVLLETTIKSSVDTMKVMGVKGPDLEDAKKEITESIRAMKGKLVQAAEKLMEAMIKDAENLAMQLFTKLDTNKDGNVSKQEFLTGYHRASSEMFNMSQMMNQLRASVMQ